MARRIFRRAVFAAVLVLALILFAFASCGRGKHRLLSGAGFAGTQQPGTGVGGNGIGAGGSSGGGIIPPARRNVPIEKVLSEIRAYEPPASAGVDPQVFESLRAELVRQIENMAATRGIASFPAQRSVIKEIMTDTRFGIAGRSASADRDDEIGLVKSDIFVTPELNGGNSLAWNETLKGDFDGNGEVNVADITPIALNFLATYGVGYGGADACKASDKALMLAKGGAFTGGTSETDASTELNVSDITEIALNYLYSGPAGYDVWRVPLAGGPAERIPNPTDSDAPSVLHTGAHTPGEPLGFTLSDLPPRGASSLRRTSTVDGNGEGWANGDYYYWIEPRGKGDNAAPSSPDAPKWNIQIRYETPFRLKAGALVKVRVDVWGDVAPVSYGINWGDGATDNGPTIETYSNFEHTYSESGTFTPLVAVEGTPAGAAVPVIVMQEAPPVTIYPDVPFAPTGLLVSPSGNGVSLNWDIVGDPVPGDVYRVYYSLRRGDSRPVELGFTSSNTFDTDITNQLPGGLSAFFKVTCERGQLESAYSNEVKYPPIAAQAPTLTLLPTSNLTRADLSWTAVPDTADYTVTGYRVYKGLELGDTAPVLASSPDPLPDTQTSYTYFPLPGESVLYFFVRTVTDIGASGRSNEVAWASIIPPAPENLAGSAGSGWIKVTWDPPTPAPVPNINGFAVRYGTMLDGSDAREFTGIPETARSYTIKDSADHPVTNGTTYYIWVASVRAGWYSDPMPPVTAIPANAPPVASLTANPTTGPAPLSVNFDATFSTDSDGTIVKYEWDWEGDGTYDYDSGAVATVSHDYTSGADFTATVRITDSDGATAPDSVLIRTYRWNTETVDSAGNVGYDVSIALDANNNPHISYWDETNGHLKYAYYNGSGWELATVDSNSMVGRATSIALDSNDLPHISYLDWANDDLKYAYHNGSGWEIATVDSGLDVGFYTSLALDSNDRPHISYIDWTDLYLKYAYNNGTAWDIETVDGQYGGGYTSIALDSNDRPNISYYDVLNYDLKYAYFNGSSWVIATVDSAGDVGQFTSIALDSNDRPHISYYDVTNLDLRYAYYNGLSWDIATVDSADSVGQYTSLALDSNNRPHISYYMQANADLKYAYYNGSSWDIATIDSSGDVGGYASIALDSSDRPHISYSSYADATKGDLKYAWYGLPR